jgi:hypothetical protein
MATPTNPLLQPGPAAQADPTAQPGQTSAAAPDQSNAQPAQPDQSNTQPDEVAPRLYDGTNGEPVNIHKAFAAVQENLIKLFDELGVKRSMTVPYIEGGDMASHLDAVSQAAAQAGGLTNNLVASHHHTGGKGYGTGDGHTVGYNTERLRETLIPRDDKNAQKLLASAKSLVSKAEALLGPEENAIKTAKAQLNVMGKHDLTGMNAMDVGVAMQNMFVPILQALARAHNGNKNNAHHPKLTGPRA